MAQTGSKVHITRGKFNSINAVADENAIIAAAAMDQRGSVRKSIAKGQGHDATDAQLSECKSQVTEVLTKYASAILLDPEYGLEAAKHRSKGAGLLLAYEKTGYDTTIQGRLPDLLSEWSVKRLVDAGADVVKILMYYDPDDTQEINTIKHAFIERIGAECRAYDIAFFLEPLSYSNTVGDEKGMAFARVKPEKVRKYMQEFSKPQYGIDVLKVEIPINMRYVEGSKANFFFQVEDGIRDHCVTGVQTCALPICSCWAGGGSCETAFRKSVWGSCCTRTSLSASMSRLLPRRCSTKAASSQAGPSTTPSWWRICPPWPMPRSTRPRSRYITVSGDCRRSLSQVPAANTWAEPGAKAKACKEDRANMHATLPALLPP